MGLIELKCPNCGANLENNDVEGSSICPVCGSPFIAEKNIKNYTVNNEIENATINFNFDPEEFVIQDGVLIEYLGNKRNVIIPDGVNTLAENCFWGKVILSLKCPESVNKIYCKFRSLTDFSAPGITEINPYQFDEATSLKSVNIPKVETVEKRGFFNCENLEKVNAPKLKVVRLKGFTGCANLREIDLSNVTVLEEDSFLHCKNLISVNIPLVKTIPNYAFSGCEKLETVNAPNARIIGSHAFSECNLQDVSFPEAEEIWDGAFYKCRSLQRINCPKAILKMRDVPLASSFGHFQYCEKLTDSNTILASKNIPSSNKKDSSKGCYVATAVYGSYDCPQVWTLRRYRDYTLAESWQGRAFIRTYYAISPTLVKWFGNTNWFKKMWKGTLDRMVTELQEKGVENTPYQDKNW